MAESNAGVARLLVTVGEGPELRQALERILPPESVAFTEPSGTGPWPAVEAWLVGSVGRELPHWTPELTPNLRFVQRLFTGLDGFPFERFPASVQVAGNVGAFAPFVAEHAVALLLAVSHNVTANAEKVRAGRLRPPISNLYLLDRTVLLLGYGAIAREVAARLRPFGARLEGLSRDGKGAPELARMYAADHLTDALAGADVIIDCRPLTDSTRGSIDAVALGRIRSSAIYVNIGRAGTVDEAALYEHLVHHPEFRAALDVWWEEDYGAGALKTRYPFAARANFLGSPHVAGVGAQARDRAIEMAVENLGRFFQGVRPNHLADRSEYTAPGR
jgi:phosphoglycerate dehydrogenase-like enzyme